jgi:hypothetical protein
MYVSGKSPLRKGCAAETLASASSLVFDFWTAAPEALRSTASSFLASAIRFCNEGTAGAFVGLLATSVCFPSAVFLVPGFFVDGVLLALSPLLALADSEVAFFIPRARLHPGSRNRKDVAHRAYRTR